MEIIFNEIDEERWCEVEYLKKVSKLLLEKIPEISVVITPHVHRNLPKTKFKKIVIVTGDEQGTLGLNAFKYPDVISVFRIFNTYDRYDNEFIYPIPPGYNWTMHNNRNVVMDRMYPEKEMEDREYDIFYSGQNVPLRASLINRLNMLSNRYKIYNKTTPSFRTGLDIDDYYRFLGNCKISPCPDGTAIDTFRYVESFGSGNIVITTKKDMDIWYYKESPAIFINSWEELTIKLIDSLLNNKYELRKKGLKYYNEYLSEKAVSDYIYNVIKNKI